MLKLHRTVKIQALTVIKIKINNFMLVSYVFSTVMLIGDTVNK